MWVQVPLPTPNNILNGAYNMKNYVISEMVDEQGKLTCPVCGEKFKPDENTKYIAAGGYTCDWKCFLKVVKKPKDKNNNK